MLIHKNHHYERIIVYSPLDEATTEYSDVIDCELIDFVPDFEFFDRDIRNCFIVEDCDTKALSKEERYKLGRFFGVYSSHNNIDIYVIAQNVYDPLPQIRRLANIVLPITNIITNIKLLFRIRIRNFMKNQRKKILDTWHILHESLHVENH